MAYNAIETDLPGVLVLEPTVFGDERGYFYESFNQRAFEDAIGAKRNFVQDNHSLSRHGVLRGMHYQVTRPQGKLVRVIRGEVFDVAVDIRPQSRYFGRWTAATLSAENRRQFWIPEGFAHGFLVLNDVAEFLYKTTDYYAPDLERCIIWNDPTLGIDWPKGIVPSLSAKDAAGMSFEDAVASGNGERAR